METERGDRYGHMAVIVPGWPRPSRCEEHTVKPLNTTVYHTFQVGPIEGPPFVLVLDLRYHISREKYVRWDQCIYKIFVESSACACAWYVRVYWGEGQDGVGRQMSFFIYIFSSQ